MGVGHDFAAESHTGTTGSQSQAFYEWFIAASDGARGLLVFTFWNSSLAAGVTSVKINPAVENIDVPAVTGGQATDTVGEPGSCRAWFIGNITFPLGGWTIRVNRSNDADIHYAVAISVNANADTHIEGTPVLLQEDGTWAEQTVGTAGVQSQGYAGSHNGGSTTNPVGANSTAVHNIDLGAQTFDVCRETTVPGSTGTKLVGFTQAVSDDRAAVHLAISEVAAVAATAPNVQRTRPFPYKPGSPRAR
jgi:hypothetical protein